MTASPHRFSRRAALIAAALLPLGPALAAETGRLEGLIVLSPATPVTRPGRPNERGIPGRVRITDQTGAIAAVVDSDAQGRFQVDLKPGSYTLHLERRRRPGRAADQHVTVSAGTVTTAKITYDAGIR